MSLIHSPTMEDLHNVLTGEADAYRQLVELTQRERVTLQAGGLPDLAATMQDKEAVIESLARWERVRNRIVTHVARELNLPGGTSLSDLIPHFDDTYAQELIALRQEFTEMVEQLLTLNHGNRLLIQAELVRIDATLDYMARIAVPPDGHYTASGNNHLQSAAGNVLNWRA